MKRSAELKALSVRLPVRSDLHLLRKIWHFGMGLLIVSVFQSGITIPASLTLLGAFLALAWTVEITRLRNPAWNAKVLKLWGPLMRSSEVNRPSGIPAYLASTWIAIAVFPRPVAALAILYLAAGDPFASLMGILYGDRGPRYKNGKSLIGTLAGIGACFLVTMIFLGSMAIPFSMLLAISLIGGVVGGTTELLPLEADDNFTIPVISGFVLWLTFIVLGV